MAKSGTRMPMSTAGITSYFEDYKSKIEFSPGHVIVACIVVVLLIVAMHVWLSGALGIV
ncbi:preprotein translocase subunit Sec61beta [Candidatus Woesearchaeota archaeon CG10_big_fil_rev_8_21_14_0_10_37_12]|nr:MAG: preprotein translocase subunit Sec61beta [Candidatus Woesearchaeota archaeon CG10_big_fil_rev_8_21_14_0_10_37_12]